ncbi:hypothetical protein CCACVL1_18722 [Corchorus capsularis]|uniref:Uncharacterized protein n=1 Tax=Corchorus capsularis TaxID=210143 RepID=A0A1R3HJU7_COCAP|nr:hypothetical protein CCACVL1_18722 [Corchorus capsularis]
MARGQEGKGRQKRTKKIKMKK